MIHSLKFSKKQIKITFPLVLILVISGSLFGCTSKHPQATQIPTSSTTTLSTTPTGQATLSVHFIDVGQGDAILIDYGTTEILIDGGERSPGVTQYIKPFIDGDLEVMVATHPHADHIGGLIAVFDSFKIDEVWTNGANYDSATYRDFNSKANSEGASLHVGRRGDSILVGGLTFFILNPTFLSGDTNEDSLVLRLVYANQSFLFTGDAGVISEHSMIASGLTLSAQVLKVGHHGSYSSSSVEFLNAVKPEIAVYMAGLNNSYGHPHQVTLDKLFSIGAKIYGTAVNGSVIIATDGVSKAIQVTKAG